jgi:nucleotide-binding universal stress UspA family protein
MTLDNVLVPTDFSPCSEAAFSRARAMADASPQATLHFLHVVTEPLHEVWTSYAPGPDFISRVRELEEAARKRLESMRTLAECERDRVVVATSWGEPAEEILRYARAHGIDLIVCGTHQHAGWARLLMGSTSERVVRFAPCPVVTVSACANLPGASGVSMETRAITLSAT